MSASQAATTRLAELVQLGSEFDKDVAARIQAAIPRLSAVNVLVVLELVGEIVNEQKAALRTVPVRTVPDGVMIPMETETYVNGTVSVDANGCIAEVEFTTPVEVV